MTQLKEVENEVEKLRVGAKETKAAAREMFGELTKNLHISLAVVEEELMELVESEAWDKLKQRINAAIKDLHPAVQNAAAQCR
ncbi:MAG: hypothetical protein BZ151_11120 [Desulfobacca sp. 4484_104]|nr:MAG: hypothetical protein BZ151_11120 [Desulfobacca sp. 4484_104]